MRACGGTYVREDQSCLVKGLTLAPEKCWSFSAVRECKPEVVAIWRAILSSSWVGGIGCGRQPGNGHVGSWVSNKAQQPFIRSTVTLQCNVPVIRVGYRRWSKWSTPLAVGLK